MYAQEYARRYATAQITNVDREQLLLLVLEGGAKFLRLTREALVGDDPRGFAENLARAQSIIAELLATLDYDTGGTIAVELGRLYEFMLLHLTRANAEKSVRHVDEVIGVFDTVLDAYRSIIVPRAAAIAKAG